MSHQLHAVQGALKPLAQSAADHDLEALASVGGIAHAAKLRRDLGEPSSPRERIHPGDSAAGAQRNAHSLRPRRMHHPHTVFVKRGLAARRSAELLIAWMDAADEAHSAYLAWRDADRGEQHTAFIVYRAALDREEAAARALEAKAAPPASP